jgi:hypothetical protein
MANIPDLEHHCNSWVVTRTVDGSAVVETFSRQIAEKFNTEGFKVETALQYLCRINKQIKSDQ